MDHYGGSGWIIIDSGEKSEGRKPGKVQLALEAAIDWATDFFEGILGKGNKRYIPYLITVLLYLACANMIGLLGFKPPTKDLNVTAALAVMSMCLIEYSGIHKNGMKHWVKHLPNRCRWLHRL